MTPAGGPEAAHRRVLSDPALWLFLGVVTLGVVQVLVLDAGARPLRGVVPTAVAAAIVALGGCLHVGRHEERGRRWLQGFAAVEVLLALWTTQAFLNALPAGLGEPSGFYRIKVLVTTPLGDHNTAAGLLLVGVVATVVLAQEQPRWWAGVATTVLGTVACLSRGAAAVLVGVALLAWLLRVRRTVAVALTAAAVVVVAAVSLLAVVLDAAPPPGAAVPDGPIGTSVVGRVDLAVRGFEVFAEHPVVGVGLGGFAEQASDLPPPNDHAHNALAHAAAEGGVVLVALAAGVVLLLAWRGLRRSPGWRREVALLGGAALVAHAQIDVLGGLLATEATIAVLLATVASPSEGRAVRRLPSGRSKPATGTRP